MPLYDDIGEGYDATRAADPYIVRRLIHHLGIRAKSDYLDVACGTGNYTVALADAGAKMAGLDQSGRMVEIARTKSSSVAWYVGNAEELPFPDGTFSGAACTLAIHHFPTLLPVFLEAFRVLDGGRFVLFTSTPEQMKRYWLNEYFPQMMAKSTSRMPSLAEVISDLRTAGFGAITTETYEVREDLQDLFLYSGKHRPALYLDPRIRAGISSFAALAEPAEVEGGCRRLAADVESGRISGILASYRHDQGDYLFVTAEKRRILGDNSPGF